jgi:hypothetical protein
VSKLTDPRVNRDRFMRECRQRMLRALTSYAELEDLINRREAEHTARWGVGIGSVEADKDPQLRILAGACNAARQRVRTYAAVIQAEQVVRQTELRTRYRGAPQPRETT